MSSSSSPRRRPRKSWQSCWPRTATTPGVPATSPSESLRGGHGDGGLVAAKQPHHGGQRGDLERPAHGDLRDPEPAGLVHPVERVLHHHPRHAGQREQQVSLLHSVTRCLSVCHAVTSPVTPPIVETHQRPAHQYARRQDDGVHAVVDDAGQERASARPDRSANTEAMPMPTLEFMTNWTFDRCAIRTSNSTAARPPEMNKDSLRSCATTQLSVNPRVGMAPSSIPRVPPSAFDSWVRTSVSRVAAVTGGAAAAGSTPDSGLELIRRVVDDALPVLARDPPPDDQPGARLDTGDLAAAEPDERLTTPSRRTAKPRGSGCRRRGAGETFFSSPYSVTISRSCTPLMA